MYLDKITWLVNILQFFYNFLILHQQNFLNYGCYRDEKDSALLFRNIA